MDDLTKLSGPELADVVDDIASSGHVPTDYEVDRLREAADRLRSDDRVAMRNRERDVLRDELAAVKGELHKWRNGHQLQAFQEDLNEMRARATDAEKERDGLRATVSRLHADMRELDDQRELLAIRVRELTGLAQRWECLPDSWGDGFAKQLREVLNGKR